MHYESTSHSFGEYAGLNYSEFCAIHAYMERNDTSALGRQILENSNLSLGFSQFIVDLITGKKKRPIKKASTRDRDYDIYLEIATEIRSGYSLKTVAERIAGNINRSVDAINKAYYRGKIIQK